jgi:FdhD protein
MSGTSQRVRLERIRRVDDGTDTRRSEADAVAVEEPLEFRVAAGGGPVVSTITMRTPGHDVDLLLGWLISEGVIASVAEVDRVTARSRGDGLEREASVQVRLQPQAVPPAGRPFAVSSACGVCGAESLAAVLGQARWRLGDDDCRVSAATLLSLPDLLAAGQAAFQRTGGLHAAGLFRTDGSPVVVREDVGRHNAVDKVIGFAAREQLLPLRGHVLQVSGRASMELVHKAVMAGVPVLSAVSAPSSLAVELARASQLTLAGFVRGNGLNIYASGERVR